MPASSTTSPLQRVTPGLLGNSWRAVGALGASLCLRHKNTAQPDPAMWAVMLAGPSGNGYMGRGLAAVDMDGPTQPRLQPPAWEHCWDGATHPLLPKGFPECK